MMGSGRWQARARESWPWSVQLAQDPALTCQMIGRMPPIFGKLSSNIFINTLFTP